METKLYSTLFCAKSNSPVNPVKRRYLVKGVTSYMEQFRDVPLEYVYFSSLRLYDKITILTPNYINRPPFLKQHYINSLLISNFGRQLT